MGSTWKETTTERVRKIAHDFAEANCPGDEHEKERYESEAIDLLDNSFYCIQESTDLRDSKYNIENGHWGTRGTGAIHRDGASLRIDLMGLSQLAYQYLGMKWLRCSVLDWFFVYTLSYGALIGSMQDATLINEGWLKYQIRIAITKTEVFSYAALLLLWSIVKLAFWIGIGAVAYFIDPALTAVVGILFFISWFKSHARGQLYQKSVAPLLSLNEVLSRHNIQAEQLHSRLEEAAKVCAFEPGLYELVSVIRREEAYRREQAEEKSPR